MPESPRVKQFLTPLNFWAMAGLILTVLCLTTPRAGAEDPATAVAPAREPLENFSSPTLDAGKWLAFLESGRREVVVRRPRIVSALGLRPGMDIADIGAGSGAFMPAIVERIGPGGRYYGVEIAPKFVEHLRALADKLQFANVTTVLGSPSSATLPTASLDLAFVCDTYVHFKSPTPMLASLFDAIRPGGTLVIVDFDRAAGPSVPWIARKVRASKEEYIHEIEAAGFRLEREEKIEGLTANFFLRFRRP
jgi:predicted methyltransferase